MKFKITKARLQQLVAEEYKNLGEAGLLTEAQGDVFKEGDKVQDDRNSDVGTVIEPMAGGAIVELEDGKKVKIRAKFLSKVEGESEEALEQEALNRVRSIVREELAVELREPLQESWSPGQITNMMRTRSQSLSFTTPMGNVYFRRGRGKLLHIMGESEDPLYTGNVDRVASWLNKKLGLKKRRK